MPGSGVKEPYSAGQGKVEAFPLAGATSLYQARSTKAEHVDSLPGQR